MRPEVVVPLEALLYTMCNCPGEARSWRAVIAEEVGRCR